MKLDANRDWKHIGVYLLICFVITYAVEIPLLWGRTYNDLAADTRFVLISNSLMLLPALSVLLTRLVTKQGWEESYLHLHLKGHAKYYALAVLLPVLGGVISAAVYAPVLGGFDFARIRSETNPAEAIGVILLQIGTSVILVLPAFGEEFGWRGYLYPLLERRIGLIPALLVGGVIWGLWHAPLTYAGHNFGQDYWGYPVMGYVMMSAFCICAGIPMHYLTRKTRSVYPAAIFHMVNNMVYGTIEGILLPQMQDIETTDPRAVLLGCVPYGLFGIVCVVLMVKDSHED